VKGGHGADPATLWIRGKEGGGGGRRGGGHGLVPSLRGKGKEKEEDPRVEEQCATRKKEKKKTEEEEKYISPHVAHFLLTSLPLGFQTEGGKGRKEGKLLSHLSPPRLLYPLRLLKKTKPLSYHPLPPLKKKGERETGGFEFRFNDWKVEEKEGKDNVMALTGQAVLHSPFLYSPRD